MSVDDAIENYIEYSLKIHNTDDFLEKKKYIEKSNKLINKIYSINGQDEFFNKLFNVNIPFVLYEIALDSLNKKYDVIKSYEIVTYLKKNSHKLNFSDDEGINDSAKKYFKNANFEIFKIEYDFYNEMADKELYMKFHQYWEYLSNHYDYYIKNNYNKNYYKPWDKEILLLLNDIKHYNKLDKFIFLTTKRLNECDLYIRLLNGYFIYKITNNSKIWYEVYRDYLKTNTSHLTNNLVRLANEQKTIIENTEYITPCSTKNNDTVYEANNKYTSLKKNSIEIELCEEYSGGLSYAGGNPLVDDKFEWPYYDEEALSFLIQIDCKELSMFDEDGVLPKEGIISLFYKFDFSPLSNNKSYEIKYFNNANELRETANPNECKYVKKRIKLSAKKSYPTIEELPIEYDADEYFEFYKKNTNNTFSQMLGYQHNLQELMQPELCKKISRTQVNDWVLLFQIEFDEFEFDLTGMIYCWITKDDLKKKKFSKTLLIYQST